MSASQPRHKELTTAAGHLVNLPGGATAAEQARQLAGLFAEHVSRENDVLLPALLAGRDADLAAPGRGLRADQRSRP